MRSLKHPWFPVIPLCIAGLIQVAGAEPPRPGQPAAPRTTAAEARENLDTELALCVALENDNEIALAKFAQTRAESKDVIKFAEKMEKDHSQFARDLERFAGNIAARR